ncbi:MAG: OmpA family protein, partial [Bacteroidota bacterium]
MWNRFWMCCMVLCLCSMTSPLGAQTSARPNGISIRGLASDFALLNGGDGLDFAQLSAGAALGFHRLLAPGFVLNLNARGGFLNYPLVDGVFASEDLFAGGELGFTFQFNNGGILKEEAFFSPYLFFGGGAYYIETLENEVPPMDIQVPAGLGLQFQFGQYVKFQIQSAFRYSVNHDFNSLEHSAGLMFMFGKPRVTRAEREAAKAEEQAPDPNDEIALPDNDGDGIPDANDPCPFKPGTAEMEGCPDEDGDGIPDHKDICPQEAGGDSIDGCPPVQDSDEDGIPDDQDPCPNTAAPDGVSGCPDGDGDGVADQDDFCPEVVGSAFTQGCPDEDNDGSRDSADDCPLLAGSKELNGCPLLLPETIELLEISAKQIEFNSGRSTFRESSFPALETIVRIAAQHPSYQIRIEGHTDAIGSESTNQRLSESRAKAVQDYLLEQGIDPDRISYEGFGERFPVALNSSKNGRALNR